jgi:mRNA deadenylase 3'-5' endonuclease subunit Ccr4
MISISEYLSDHKAQEYKIREDFNIMTWNVLTQCKLYYDIHYNNGFGLIENHDQYLVRVDKIVKEISSKNAKIIALQEVSHEMFNKVSNLLPSNWLIYYKGDLLTAFDKNYMEVKVIDKIQADLGEQKRINGFHITTKDFAMDFFNQHFQWYQPGSDYYNKTVDLLQELVNNYNKSIITGDFNLNIMDINLKNCNVYAELDSRISGKLDENREFSQYLETCDGFIVTGL